MPEVEQPGQVDPLAAERGARAAADGVELHENPYPVATNPFSRLAWSASHHAARRQAAYAEAMEPKPEPKPKRKATKRKAKK